MRQRTGGVLATALAAAALTVVAGCAVPNESGSGEAAGDAASGGSGEEGGTLTVLHHFGTETQRAALEAQNELFEEANPGWTVESVQVPGDQQDQQLLARAATQEGPDVFFNNIVVDFPVLVAGGVMKDITEEWESYEDADLYPESAVWTSDDKVYNLMTYTNLIALYYNQDILDELGIEPPTTVEELEAAMATVTESGQYEGLAASGQADNQGAWTFLPLLLSQGVDYCNLDDPATTAEFERLATWVDQGWLPGAAATWDQGDAWQQFMTGDYAFGINGNWNLGDARENAAFEFGVTQYPATGEESVVLPGGEGIAIGAFTEHPEMAWKYVEQAWLSQEGGLRNFTESKGQVPIRADVAETEEVQADTLMAPFVEAAQNSASWPNNEQSPQMQNALGEAFSAVISGQAEPAQAAQDAIADVQAAIEEGGGTC